MARFPHALPNVSKMAEIEAKIKASSKEIDYCDIGDECAVYNRNSGTLLVLNSSAFAIFEALGKGATSSEIARTIAAQSSVPYNSIFYDINTQINQWFEAGLFDEPGRVPEHAPKPLCYLKTGFQSGERNFVFSSNDQNIFALFGDLLAPLSAKIKGQSELSFTVEGDGFSVWFDGEHLFGPGEFPPARHTAIAKIAALAANNNVGCVFHASAFMSNNKSFLVSGRSGAGKSTLTASMAAQNAVYLADDLVAMNEPMNALFPNPVRLNVKANSFRLLSVQYPDLQTSVDWNVAGTNTRYIQPARLPNFKSCAVDYLIFPRFASQATVGMSRLQNRDALMKLALNGIDLSRKTGAIRRLVKFITTTPCYDLNYSSTTEAHEMINQILHSK